ncbi:MAG TPA: bile acid:sodium symporter [Candidatus Ozemobacteraceae bacterium]|nr:bile acid:sodium symporter [Candidatus Ozemobacteraceae bacterium]
MIETLRRLGEKFNLLIERRLFAIILLFMLTGWLLGPAIGLAGARFVVPVLFGFMTWYTSLRCSWREFARLSANPGPVVLVLVLLHGLVTLFGWGTGRLLYADHPDLIAGFVLCGAIPIGITSAVWTGIVGGDVALSLAAITVDTLLSPLIVPAVILLFLGRSVGLDIQGIMADLLVMVVLPSIVGITMNDLSKGTLYQRVKPFLGPFSTLSLGMVVAINLATSRQAILGATVNPGFLLLVIVIVVLFGFAAGTLVPRLLRYDRKQQYAILFSVGIRNLSAGLVIALDHFPPLTLVPVIVSMLFQQPLAALSRVIIQSRPGRDAESSDGSHP